MEQPQTQAQPQDEPIEEPKAELLPHSEHKVKYHNIIITLLSLLVLPVYLYGPRIFLLLAAGLATALALELFCMRVLLRGTHQKYDYSGVVTALIVVMLMPSTVPPWVVCVSVAVGLCVAKYPFGGVSHNIFNPAAVGVAFSALSWPELVMKYPVPYTTYGLENSAPVQFGSSPASVLRIGGTPKIDYFDILLGKFAGPLGVTCVIVLAACAFYLLFRRVISKRIVFSALAVVALFAVFFPRVMTGRIDSLVYELSSGALLFSIIFMTGDPSTTPKTGGGRMFYGVILGAFMMLFRHFGKMELVEVFALLFANVFATSCDRYATHLSARFSNGAKNMRNGFKRKRGYSNESDLKKAGEADA